MMESGVVLMVVILVRNRVREINEFSLQSNKHWGQNLNLIFSLDCLRCFLFFLFF